MTEKEKKSVEKYIEAIKNMATILSRTSSNINVDKISEDEYVIFEREAEDALSNMSCITEIFKNITEYCKKK